MTKNCGILPRTLEEAINAVKGYPSKFSQIAVAALEAILR